MAVSSRSIHQPGHDLKRFAIPRNGDSEEEVIIFLVWLVAPQNWHLTSRPQSH